MSLTSADSKPLDALKDLLIKDEKNQIQRIENRLDDPMVRAKEISRSLPQAIRLSELKSNKISRVLQPVIDASIKTSVQNNPRALADALAPALGPGIRKAISSTIMGMIQSLSQILNHSVSIQGLKWRFEAFRSRKQFAEIVLLHTLVYQVEQIFLIHRDSGIVLEHVVAKDIIIQDPDLVSGMLTAIQDFVKDSFHSDTEDGLETLRIGSDRSVWIENGEHALIAAVIRGTPPVDLRVRYRELIEDIHMQSGNALKQFDGDPLPFSIFREHLKDGLQFQEKTDRKKISPLFWPILILVLSLIGIWGFNRYQTNQAWHRYQTLLKNQKGLIILSIQKTGTHYQVYGLKDPMAKDPVTFMGAEEKKRFRFTGHWKPFFSLDPEFILNRAHHLLSPPSAIRLDLNGSILVARGKASQKWIDRFQQSASFIPGIDGFNDDQVINIEEEKLAGALTKLMTLKLYFENNSSRLVPGQEAILDQAFKVIQTIQVLQSKLKTTVQIVILGHTDSSGNEKINLTLSRNRARKIFNHLIIKGINPAFLTPSGIGTKIPLTKENTVTDRQYNRAATFKAFYTSSTKGRIKND